MAAATLSLPERATLLALMILVGEASNNDVQEAFKFKVEKKVRESLKSQGLITVRMSEGPHPAFLHELTDTGWVRCRQELAETAPNGADRGYRLLYGLSGVLDAYLIRAGLNVADIFSVDGYAEMSDTVVPLTAGEIDDRIRGTYDRLASRSGDWVSLTRLRAALELPRPDVDDALRRLVLHQVIHLIPESNQKALTPADRKAAIHVGGEDKHLLSIERG
ncbi:MAG TPA: hypothetical protein VF444_17350 [Pseudonocardiaceae bacterium]